MKIVIAPDSFKESLTAKQVAQCVENGFRAHFPDAEYHHLPLADGGEGTVDVLMHGLGGKKITSKVTGPYGDPVEASWALLNDGTTALIEIAAASGLDLTDPEQRNPLLATSFGTGQIIKHALDQGVSHIIIGLGGSATNDAGAGIAQALGARLLNESGAEVAIGGGALANVASVDLSKVDPRCASVAFTIACDVNNPLIGTNGASYVFGPQKGATAEQVKLLDAALAQFARVCQPAIGINHRDSSGFGAAGGAPLGLSLLFNTSLKPGIEMVLDCLNADNLLDGADLLITGEGQMDNQTLQGKTPYGIAKRAKLRHIPVIGIAGSIGQDIDLLYGTIDSVFGTVRSPQPLSQVLEEAETNLTRTARNVAATLALGRQLITNADSK